MGIESEQLVFDYLSRVGDLAHGTSMTAADRARLVSGLRTEIDRMRARSGGAESNAAVRKVLDRLGKPEEVVSTALGGAAVSAPKPGPGVQAGPEPEEPRTRRLPKLPQMRKPGSGPEPPRSRGASPPHLAGMDELGPQESDPDWWRADRRTPGGTGRQLGYDIPEAFVGGIELPEVLERPPEQGAGTAGGPPPVPLAPGLDGAADASAAAAAGGRKRTRLGALFARRTTSAAGPAAGGAVELLAAALLVAGAVMGSLIPLGLGWLAAYWSPRLTRTEGKWAALGIPALTAVGCLVWVWGRGEGRWGAPLAAGGDAGGEAMREALTGMWPVALRVAAVASALYLVWRARRRPRGG